MGFGALVDGKLHIWPDIPQDKLANAIAAYAGAVQPVSPKEVVLLYDNTVFGSAKDGLCISLHALSWHNMNEQAWRVDLAAIQQARSRADDSIGGWFGNMRVLINGSHAIKIVVGDDLRKIASTLAGLLRDLGEQARRLPRAASTQ